MRKSCPLYLRANLIDSSVTTLDMSDTVLLSLFSGWPAMRYLANSTLINMVEYNDGEVTYCFGCPDSNDQQSFDPRQSHHSPELRPLTTDRPLDQMTSFDGLQQTEQTRTSVDNSPEQTERTLRELGSALFVLLLRQKRAATGRTSTLAQPPADAPPPPLLLRRSCTGHRNSMSVARPSPTALRTATASPHGPRLPAQPPPAEPATAQLPLPAAAPAQPPPLPAATPNTDELPKTEDNTMSQVDTRVAEGTRHLPHLWDLCSNEVSVRSAKHIFKLWKYGSVLPRAQPNRTCIVAHVKGVTSAWVIVFRSRSS
nr:clustered mitochondria protein [Ipomoea batatas]